MIYADFESLLEPEFNGSQNPNTSCTNKYQKDIACNYGYKLVCVDDNFNRPFKSYFISHIIEIGKYCRELLKKRFNKDHVMTKEDIEDFENSNKW